MSEPSGCAITAKSPPRSRTCFERADDRSEAARVDEGHIRQVQCNLVVADLVEVGPQRGARVQVEVATDGDHLPSSIGRDVDAEFNHVDLLLVPDACRMPSSVPRERSYYTQAHDLF